MGFFAYRRGPGGRGRRSGGFMPGCLIWSLVLSVVLTVLVNVLLRAL